MGAELRETPPPFGRSTVSEIRKNVSVEIHSTVIIDFTGLNLKHTSTQKINIQIFGEIIV